mgnify:FL=1
MIDSNKLIIGFDPGLINTGWGVIQKTNKSEICIDYGCISTIKNIELGKRLLFIYEESLRLVEKYSPSSIAIEKIFANKNPESTLKLGKARAMIFLVAAKQNVEIFEYSPKTIKKNLVGYGHATKFQMKKMIERIFSNLKIENEDSADALAVAICHSMQKQSKIFSQG